MGKKAGGGALLSKTEVILRGWSKMYLYFIAFTLLCGHKITLGFT